jgi:hypothetical protein
MLTFIMLTVLALQVTQSTVPRIDCTYNCAQAYTDASFILRGMETSRFAIELEHEQDRRTRSGAKPTTAR